MANVCEAKRDGTTTQQDTPIKVRDRGSATSRPLAETMKGATRPIRPPMLDLASEQIPASSKPGCASCCSSLAPLNEAHRTAAVSLNAVRRSMSYFCCLEPVRTISAFVFVVIASRQASDLRRFCQCRYSRPKPGNNVIRSSFPSPECLVNHAYPTCQSLLRRALNPSCHQHQICV